MQYFPLVIMLDSNSEVVAPGLSDLGYQSVNAWKKIYFFSKYNNSKSANNFDLNKMP